MNFKDYYEEVTFDVGEGVSRPLFATKGDTESRGLYVSLYDKDSKRITNLDNLSMTLTYRRTDKQGDILKAVRDGEKFRIDFPLAMFSIAGSVQMELSLIGKLGEIITSRLFSVKVRGNLAYDVLDTDAINSLLGVFIQFVEEEIPQIRQNELERRQAEDTRVSAEDARVSTESTRESNEATRESNETTRKSAETDRVSAEESRVTAEIGRVSAEQDRVSAETTRKTQESTRQSNETSRESAETSRVNAESSRVTAESARVTAEGLRASAESARESNETTRESNETARKSAENDRISAESGRVTAENARGEAEGQRQGAEDIRTENELARISNMQVVEGWIANPMQFKGDKGDSFDYVWDGTSLGIKTDKDAEYIYVDLKGEVGEGLKILGNLESESELPVSANIGDAYLINQNLYVWQGTEFTNVGEIRGPQGEQGTQGNSIEFNWNGTQLGVRIEGQEVYQYVDLKGAKGDDGADGAQGPPGPGITVGVTEPTDDTWWYEEIV